MHRMGAMRRRQSNRRRKRPTPALMTVLDFRGFSKTAIRRQTAAIRCLAESDLAIDFNGHALVYL